MEFSTDKPLTTGEIAKYCHVTAVAVLKWIKAGKLNAYSTPGGHYRVQPDEFREFLKRYVMPVPKNIQGKSEPHILIVDDDEGIHKGLERIFHNMEEKFHIHKAYNGYEACVLIGRHPLSLAIIDLMMPNMNGMELCEIIRSMEETKDLPILIISGFIDDEKIEKLTKLQVENFLSKPFSHQKLTKTVKRILEENKA